MTSSLYLGDCLEIMPTLPAASVDLCVTSPPYNVGVDYNLKGYEEDHLPWNRYRRFADKVMAEIYRLLVAGGRACIEIGGSGRNLPLSYTWQDSAYEAGFGLFAEIVIPHRKTNPCAWGSWLRADNVYTIPNFHSLYVFYKDTATKRGRGETTITSQEFSEWTRGVWTINYSVDKVKEHPATFPVSLPKRCLCLFGHKGDVVIDPMMGVGTTGLACAQLQRDFIGVELEEVYFKIAEKRIGEAQKQMVLDL